MGMQHWQLAHIYVLSQKIQSSRFGNQSEQLA